MKRIHVANAYEQDLIENLVFDLEDFRDYTIVSSDQAQILMLGLGLSLPDCDPDLVIIYDWFHCAISEDSWLERVKQKYHRSQIRFVTSIPDQKTAGIDSHFYDILFNRTKAYYSQFPFRILQNKIDRPWYYAGQDSYKINLNLTQTLPGDCVNRIFIFCARVHHWKDRSTPARDQISRHLEQYQHLGYYFRQDVGAGSTMQKIGLLSGMDDPLINGKQIFNIDTGIIEKSAVDGPVFFRGADYFRGYAPVHVNYYNKSLVTFTSESLETSAISVTEKTYDPMIHAHLIMPFGASGLVKHLKNLGWQFADFINYDYDAIDDNEQRLRSYMDELDRLLGINLNDWKDLYKKNIDVVDHNQRKFWIDPYHRMTHLLD